jgi:hypothetical protein
MKKLLAIPMLCCVLIATAQTQFHSAVKVEFEKTINVHAYIKEIDEQWYDWIKDRIPKTKLGYYNFIGDSTRSVYKRGREAADDNEQQFWLPADSRQERCV